MLKLRLTDLDDTCRLARALAAVLNDGDVVLLDGEMGAGKTTMTKELAAALGVTDDVTSPTYTLVHSYGGGKFALHHADLYRLKQTSEIEDLGIEEMLDAGGVALIEWGSPAGPYFPEHLFVSFELAGGDARIVTLASKSEAWESRIAAVGRELKDLVV